MTRPSDVPEHPQQIPPADSVAPVTKQAAEEAERPADPAPSELQQAAAKPAGPTVRQPLERRLTVMWKRMKRFAVDEWQIWLSLLGLVASALLALPFAATLVDQFVIAGAILQIAGVLTVAYGLHETRKLFNRPGIVSKFLKIFEPPRHVTLQVQGSSIGISSDNVTLTVGRRAGRKTAERLAALEAEIDEIRKSAREVEKSRKNDLAGLREALGIEGRERGQGDKALQMQIESAVLGGLRVEITGVVWLLAGVISSTVPAFAVWITSPIRTLLGLG